MSKIIIDLAGAPLLGTAAKSAWLIRDYLDQGYSVTIVNKDWSEDLPVSGVTYDAVDDKYNMPSWTQLWDPNTHPNDFFENLIFPSFEGITFLQPEKKSFFGKIGRVIRTLTDPEYITNHDFVTMHMSSRERKEYRKQKLGDIWANKSVWTVPAMLYFCLQSYITSRFKKKAHASPFRYKLSPDLYTSKVKEFIKNAKNENERYILVSVTWDENGKFERREFKRGGPRYDSEIFQSLLDYVSQLDSEAIAGGKFRFLLASKKAVEWETFLKSDFLDLRNFEALGFCLSQSLFIAQELAVATINWPSTYTIWITNCGDTEHLTWMNDIDTSPWARNSIHHRPVSVLLSKIGAL